MIFCIFHIYYFYIFTHIDLNINKSLYSWSFSFVPYLIDLTSIWRSSTDLV